MPLIQSSSKKALKSNIETEMEAHPSKKHRAQDLAIAYSTQRRNMHKKKMAMGGEMPPKADMEKESHYDAPEKDFEIDDLADSILARRKMMAEGGEVDLVDSNAEIHPNEEDDLSYELLHKQTYDEQSALDSLSEEMGSNEHGDDHLDSDELDMVDAVRKRMKAKLR